ncbi:MAG TPA: ATP-dependent metallopeptidase FtsH/Yme1/Tma family protein, partial [Actinomycetota bacterium]|nr:ATP-dependent metallopeptidase FtsH/Yme1/Tma family protein [Actinomycetota bacterium]
MQRPVRVPVLPFLLVFAILFVVGSARQPEPKEPFNYSRFLAHVESGGVERVRLDAGDNSIEVRPKRGDGYKTAYPDNTEQALVDRLRAANIPIAVKAKRGSGIWGSLIYVVPFVLFLLFWLFIIRRMSGAGGQMTRFAKSKAKLQTALDRPDVTFRDVAGVEEAVEELHEIKEFLE